MNRYTEVLKEKNLKLTPQRIAIYNYLYNTKSHPTVETIYANVKEEYPSMSLATVYKTVDTLKQVGLLQQINVGEDSFRYDADVTPHIHFICNKCNNVYDIDSSREIGNIRKDIENISRHMVTSEMIYFYGACAKCK